MTEQFNLDLPSSPPLSHPCSRKSSIMSISSRLPRSPHVSPEPDNQSTQYISSRPRISLLPSPAFLDMIEDMADKFLICKDDLSSMSTSEDRRTAGDSTSSQLPETSIEQNSEPNKAVLTGLGLSTQPLCSRVPSVHRSKPFHTASPSTSIRRRSSLGPHSILSSEGDWFAGTLEYPESPLIEETDSASLEVATAKSRQKQCQIVGHSPSSFIDGCERKTRPGNKFPIVGVAIPAFTSNFESDRFTRGMSLLSRLRIFAWLRYVGNPPLLQAKMLLRFGANRRHPKKDLLLQITHLTKF